MSTSTLKIEILDDGTIKINAQEMAGSEKEILELLNELADTTSGELKVEKHVHKHGHHHSHDDHGHHHN